MSRRLPIFPLGTVLVPTGLLPVRLFEPRYLAMMDDLLAGDESWAGGGGGSGDGGGSGAGDGGGSGGGGGSGAGGGGVGELGAGGGGELGAGGDSGASPRPAAELGVVGIERGHEVGGGEVRFRVGALAHLLEASRQADGLWTAVLGGVGRFRVEEWLPDDPYPLALVTDLPEPAWDDADDAALAGVQARTEQVLAMAVESGDLAGPVRLAWAPERAIAAWQVCAAAPLGPFDRQRLLEAGSVADRLAILGEELEGAAEVLSFRLGDSDN